MDVMAGQIDISNDIVSGKLKGLLDVRDNNLLKSLDKLDRLAASLTKEFNVLHSQGFGLDGSTGVDFFSTLAPVARPGGQNTGSALAVGSIYDQTLLTLDKYEVQFTTSTTFDIVNLTDSTIVSSGNVYASGVNIDFEGIRLVISGAPLVGDTFTLDSTENAAANFAISLTDANQFAAASDPLALPGDNTNVLAMISIIDSSLAELNNSSFSSYYQSIVSDIGSATDFALTNVNAQAVVYGELTNFRDSISGVSMDEEGINLIKFQHAYEAAAKVISTVDSMFDTLLRMR
jgi:flagellar hook-associated protein 1 FlgK